MNLIEILDLAETTTPTFRALIQGQETEAVKSLAAELGKRLSYSATTDEDWDSDENGDPVCRTTTTVKLMLDDEEIATGEAKGYYTHCRSGGEQWSYWQDSDGPECDSDWDIIAAILEAAKVIRRADDLRDSIEAPAEPAEPTTDDEGNYVVLYKGWQCEWTLKTRHASEEDAQRAMRIAERATREACGPNAYGWEYAIAVIDEEGETEVGGLTLTIQAEEVDA